MASEYDQTTRPAFILPGEREDAFNKAHGAFLDRGGRVGGFDRSPEGQKFYQQYGRAGANGATTASAPSMMPSRLAQAASPAVPPAAMPAVNSATGAPDASKVGMISKPNPAPSFMPQRQASAAPMGRNVPVEMQGMDATRLKPSTGELDAALANQGKPAAAAVKPTPAQVIPSNPLPDPAQPSQMNQIGQKNVPAEMQGMDIPMQKPSTSELDSALSNQAGGGKYNPQLEMAQNAEQLSRVRDRLQNQQGMTPQLAEMVRTGANLGSLANPKSQASQIQARTLAQNQAKEQAAAAAAHEQGLAQEAIGRGQHAAGMNAATQKIAETETGGRLHVAEEGTKQAQIRADMQAKVAEMVQNGELARLQQTLASKKPLDDAQIAHINELTRLAQGEQDIRRSEAQTKAGEHVEAVGRLKREEERKDEQNAQRAQEHAARIEEGAAAKAFQEAGWTIGPEKTWVMPNGEKPTDQDVQRVQEAARQRIRQKFPAGTRFGKKADGTEVAQLPNGTIQEVK